MEPCRALLSSPLPLHIICRHTKQPPTHRCYPMLQGSEKLLQLVSDYSRAQSFSSEMMEASKELEELLRKGYENGSVNEKAISDICIKFKLNKIDVLKWRDLV